VPFRTLNAWPRAGFKPTLLGYFDACAGSASAFTALSRSTSACTLDFFVDKLDRPMATLRVLHYPATARRRRDRRGRAHRLRQHHAAGDRRCRRPRSAHPRRRMDRRAADEGRLRRQHRRLPDALDQRRLCLDAAPGGQPLRARALFDRLLLDPNPDARVEAIPSCVPEGESPKYPPIRRPTTSRCGSTRASRPCPFTFLDGEWFEGNKPILGPRTHAFWLGSSVFDGARAFEGVTPDLDRHCARVNRSAKTMWLKPTMSDEAIVELAREGVKKFAPAPLYIRPMYWAERNGRLGAARSGIDALLPVDL
jgi:hypothetical protein